MKRRFRLTRSTDFQRVRRQGRSYAHPLLVLIALPKPEGEVRFGVSAGRRIGNAVQRNRAKRLIRAALLPYLDEVQPGWDVVILARAPLVGAGYAETHQALRSLLNRAGLLKITDDSQEELAA